jgi:2-keto-4-pentenoate hydratase/2-oxohepta-3-ene-1,7-dioic acid hydratase in catechol pathway
MRLARWRQDGRDHDGVVVGDRLVDLPDGRTTLDVIRDGLDRALELGERLGAAVPADAAPVDAVQLLAPLVPPAIRDFVAFEEHVEGITRSVDGAAGPDPQWYEAPTFYFTNPHTVSGPSDVLRPPVTERLDFELEVGLVVGAVDGSDGANLDPADAGAHIFGYTILNDWSARDLQGREMKVRLGPAKGKDFGTTLGPWIVTADELEPFLDAEGFLAVRAEVYVNGDLVGDDLVSNAGCPSPSSSPTPRATPASCRATCSARAPSATADASPSCGAGRAA